MTSVTFSGNSATSNGGGIENTGSSSNPPVRNTIFWGNTAYTRTQIFNDGGSSVVSDSVVQSGCPAGITCTNIIITDPKLGPLGNYGGSTQTIPLLPGSAEEVRSALASRARHPVEIQVVSRGARLT